MKPPREPARAELVPEPRLKDPKNKSRQGEDWKDNSNRRNEQPPKKHTPSKNHQKY